MPRPLNALGRPGTRVIPSDWSDSHRPVAEKTMTGSCEIRRPGGTSGSYNSTTMTKTVTPHAPHYAGFCRLQIRPTFTQDTASAEQPATTHSYLVTIPWNAASDGTELEVDDLVTMTAVDDNGDPSLVDRELVVRGITRGTLTWERDLLCEENLTVARPTS